MERILIRYRKTFHRRTREWRARRKESNEAFIGIEKLKAHNKVSSIVIELVSFLSTLIALSLIQEFNLLLISPIEESLSQGEKECSQEESQSKGLRMVERAPEASLIFRGFVNFTSVRLLNSTAFVMRVNISCAPFPSELDFLAWGDVWWKIDLLIFRRVWGGVKEKAIVKCCQERISFFKALVDLTDKFHKTPRTQNEQSTWRNLQMGKRLIWMLVSSLILHAVVACSSGYDDEVRSRARELLSSSALSRLRISSAFLFPWTKHIALKKGKLILRLSSSLSLGEGKRWKHFIMIGRICNSDFLLRPSISFIRKLEKPRVSVLSDEGFLERIWIKNSPPLRNSVSLSMSSHAVSTQTNEKFVNKNGSTL